MSEFSARIGDHLAGLTDPRRREATYPLENIVVMALCAVLSGADDFVSIARWAEKKKEWLARLLDMSAGVPSHDRLNAILGALRPAGFEKCGSSPELVGVTRPLPPPYRRAPRDSEQQSLVLGGAGCWWAGAAALSSVGAMRCAGGEPRRRKGRRSLSESPRRIRSHTRSHPAAVPL